MDRMIEREMLKKGQTFDETFDDGIAVEVRSFMPYANLPQLAHNSTLTVRLGCEKSEDRLLNFEVLPKIGDQRDEVHHADSPFELPRHPYILPFISCVLAEHVNIISRCVICEVIVTLLYESRSSFSVVSQSSRQTWSEDERKNLA